MERIFQAVMIVDFYGMAPMNIFVVFLPPAADPVSPVATPTTNTTSIPVFLHFITFYIPTMAVAAHLPIPQLVTLSSATLFVHPCMPVLSVQRLYCMGVNGAALTH